MKQNKDSFNKASTLLALTVILSSVVYAWTGPSGTPPNNNVATPLNVGVEGQAKLGGLGIGGTFLSSLSAVFDGSATFNGTIKIPTGAGLGKVLTSDASGNVAWQPVPTPTIDTNVIQSRVTGSCAVGQAITAVNANGTVTCGDKGGVTSNTINLSYSNNDFISIPNDISYDINDVTKCNTLTTDSKAWSKEYSFSTIARELLIATLSSKYLGTNDTSVKSAADVIYVKDGNGSYSYCAGDRSIDTISSRVQASATCTKTMTAGQHTVKFCASERNVNTTPERLIEANVTTLK